MKAIQWIPKKVLVEKIKPTPKNYKIKTELGRQRLQESLKRFGLASTVVVNADYTLIDGNSRYEEAVKNKEKSIWVSVPNRLLTPEEFKEMSAMFDYATSGTIDIEEIQKDFSGEDFAKRWNLKVPVEILNKMGAKKPIKAEERKQEKKKKLSEEKAQPLYSVVHLVFNNEQLEKFWQLEKELEKEFGVEDVSLVVLKAFELYLSKKSGNNSCSKKTKPLGFYDS